MSWAVSAIRVLHLQDFQEITAVYRHEQALWQSPAHLVLDPVCLRLALEDPALDGNDTFLVAGGQRLEQRRDLTRALEHDTHVTLQGRERRLAEQAPERIAR